MLLFHVDPQLYPQNQKEYIPFTFKREYVVSPLLLALHLKWDEAIFSKKIIYVLDE